MLTKKAPEADFFIHAGDLVNAAHDESEWNEWFAAGSFIHSEIPAIAVPGNHEYRGLDYKTLVKIGSFPSNGMPNLIFPPMDPKD